MTLATLRAAVEQRSRHPWSDVAIGVVLTLVTVGLMWTFELVGAAYATVVVVAVTAFLGYRANWRTGLGAGVTLALVGAFYAHPHACNDTATTIDRSYCGDSFSAGLVLLGAMLAIGSLLGWQLGRRRPAAHRTAPDAGA